MYNSRLKGKTAIFEPFREKWIVERVDVEISIW